MNRARSARCRTLPRIIAMVVRVAAMIVLARGLCGAQAVEVECGTDTQLTAAAFFNPPVPGPIRYEWRDAADRLIGEDTTLHLGPLALPVGPHIITVIANGAEGQRPRSAVAVAVLDTQPPRLTIPFRLIELPDGTADARKAPGVRVVDGCDPNPSIILTPSGPFPTGETSVTASARDASGNVAELTITVRVREAQQPAPPEPERPPPPSPPVPPPVVVQAPPAPPPPPVEQPAPEPEPPPITPPPAAPVAVAAVPVVPAVEPPPLPAQSWSGWWWLIALLALLLLAAAAKIVRKMPPSVLQSTAKVDLGQQRVKVVGVVRVVRRAPRA